MDYLGCQEIRKSLAKRKKDGELGKNVRERYSNHVGGFFQVGDNTFGLKHRRSGVSVNGVWNYIRADACCLERFLPRTLTRLRCGYESEYPQQSVMHVEVEVVVSS